MKTKFSAFIAAIIFLLLGTTIIVAQKPQAYFKQNGVTVFQSAISDIDSIIFVNFPGYEFFTNPNDPYFLKWVNEDGTEIIFSGDKNENGELLDITNIKITNGNNECNAVYSNGQVVEFYDNDNNIIFINYNDSTQTAIASFIPQNSDTVYYFQVAYQNNTVTNTANVSSIDEKLLTNINSLASTTTANDGYYLRYKVNLEFVGIAPNSKFSTNYYTSKVIIYDNDVNFEKNAELIETGNNYAIYQLKLNPAYENQPLQNYIANAITSILDFVGVSTFTLNDVASTLLSTWFGKFDPPGTSAIGDAMGEKIQNFLGGLSDFMDKDRDPYDLPKAIKTDRKIGDDFKIAVSVTGTGCNSQTQIQEISYINLKQEQGKAVHLEFTLTNIFPFEEAFMYAPQEDPDWVEINGVKWATRNVGVVPHTFTEKPEDFGGYYQWNRGTTDLLLPNDYYNSEFANSTSWLPENDPCPDGWQVPNYATGIAGLVYGGTPAKLNGVFGYTFANYEGTNTVFLPNTGFYSYYGIDADSLIYNKPSENAIGNMGYWASSSTSFATFDGGGSYAEGDVILSYGYPWRSMVCALPVRCVKK